MLEEERQKAIVEAEAYAECQYAYEQKLREWRLQHACFKCKALPIGPVVRSEKVSWKNDDGMKDVTYWSEAEGFDKCNTCQRWACHKHIYKGKCQNCSERR